MRDRLPVVFRSGDAEHQANMEGQSKVHIRELLLRVEVCAARDDPPAILVGVDVPHVVAGVENGLRIDLLHESHFKVGRLPLKDSRTSSISSSVAFNMVYSRDGLVALRCKGLRNLINRPMSP